MYYNLLTLFERTILSSKSSLNKGCDDDELFK